MEGSSFLLLPRILNCTSEMKNIFKEIRPRREFNYGLVHLSLLENAQNPEWSSDVPRLIQLTRQYSFHAPLSHVSRKRQASQMGSWEFRSYLGATTLPFSDSNSNRTDVWADSEQ